MRPDQALSSATVTHPLLRLLELPRKRVVGLMSGTSLDGVDAALVEVEGFGDHIHAHLIDFRCTPFDDETRQRIEDMFTASAPALCQGNFELGEAFARAALVFGAGSFDLVGSHGQTIWHHPPSVARSHGHEIPSTLQLGEPAVIAARTGVVTVGDFRVADVAQGGEGAPLVPYADWALFRPPSGRRALQNIGGIANVSVVGPRREEVFAFDNGPGNMIIDALAPIASKGVDEIDRDGRYSALGQVQEDLLRDLMADEFLNQSPPKSTGRERYGREFVRRFVTAHTDRHPLDLLATMVAFCADAILDSYRRFILPTGTLDEVLISGGGAHNRTLIQRLASGLAPTPVRALAEGTISADAKEAVAFATLAVQAIHAEPANLPRVTGARQPAVLGKICLP
jgi:anhydro-N-acetylmuramic acid kinase